MKTTVGTPLTVILRSLVDLGVINEKERVALLACVDSGYDLARGGPDRSLIALKMHRLMMPLLLSQSKDKMDGDDLTRAITRAQLRTGCPYLGLAGEKRRRTAVFRIVVPYRTGTRDITEAISVALPRQAALVAFFDGLSRGNVTCWLSRISDDMARAHTPAVRTAWKHAAEVTAMTRFYPNA